MGMLRFTLITRPGRAVAIVAVVGLLFAAQGAIALRWPQPGHGWGAAGTVAGALLVAALAAAIVGIVVLTPLHSRGGTIGVWAAGAGLGLSLLPASASLVAGRSMLTGLAWFGAVVAAAGIVAIVPARRNEGDLPAGLLAAALLAAAIGPLVADRGGCRAAGAAWIGVSAVLWGAYLAPESGLHRAPVVPELPEPARSDMVALDARRAHLSCGPA